MNELWKPSIKKNEKQNWKVECAAEQSWPAGSLSAAFSGRSIGVFDVFFVVMMFILMCAVGGDVCWEIRRLATWE